MAGTWRAVAAGVALATAGPLPAYAGTVTRTAGGISATLTYAASPQRDLDQVTRVTVTGPGGSRTFTEAELPVPEAGAGSVLWGIAPTSRPLTVRDLNGDGTPEVTVDAYWGGAHCCYMTAVLYWTPSTSAWNAATRVWGDWPPVPRDDDRDGVVEFAGRDPRFSYAFGSYVGSSPPVAVWHFRGGTFVPVTRAYTRYVRRDVRARWSAYAQARRTGRDYAGAMAGYIASEALLGRRAAAVRRVRATHPAPRQLRSVLAHLTRWGYR